MDGIHRQKGRNSKYPELILTWKPGDDAPDWLIDICKVIKLQDDGKPLLDLGKTNTGGIILKTADGNKTLIKTNSSPTSTIPVTNYSLILSFKTTRIISIASFINTSF